MSDNRSDNELICAFRDGDEEAFPILFERYKNLFLVWGNCICPNHEEPKELSQEAREAICERLKDFKPGGEIVFKEWLKTISFQSVFELYKELVFKWAFRICRNYEDALDISQEVFIAVWRALDTFEYRGESKFKAWLKKITTRKALNFVMERDRRREDSWDTVDEEGKARSMEFPDESPSSEEEVIEKETFEKICEAIDSLPDQEKKVIRLRYLEGLKIKEIAEKLGLAEGTVKAHIDHGKRKLRKKLEPILEN